jgi:hypothetical protein
MRMPIAKFDELEVRASPAMNPTRPPIALFFHPDGEKWPSRAPGSPFPPGFGPSSIQQAQAILGPPRRAWGLRTREKRGWARSVGERTREPYYLVANPPLPSLVALSLPAPPLANPPAGCLHSAVPPPTILYSTVRRAVAIFHHWATPPVAPRRHARQVFVYLPGRI